MFWPGHCIIERRPIAQPSVIPYSKTNIFWQYIWLYSCQNAIKKRGRDGPLTRYVKLRVAHAPGIPGTFSPPLNSKETASWRSQYASRHVHDVRAVMHFVIANPCWRGKCSRHSRCMPSRNFTYQAGGPCTHSHCEQMHHAEIISNHS